MTMPYDAIKAVQAAGFEVYMSAHSADWLYFTDGTNIAYLENGRLRPLRLSTVHIANQITGTGFSIDDDLFVADIDADRLRSAFVHAPGWAGHHERQATRKYKDWDTFNKSGGNKEVHDLSADQIVLFATNEGDLYAVHRRMGTEADDAGAWEQHIRRRVWPAYQTAMHAVPTASDEAVKRAAVELHDYYIRHVTE